MADKKAYWELLRDPKWQRKRLEVMQRADFRCEVCGSDQKTLNVHHKLYRKGAMPWEYELHELQCLCEECHVEHHGLNEDLKSALARLEIDGLEQVLGYVRGLIAGKEVEPSDEDPEPPKPAAYELLSESFAAGFWDANWIDYSWKGLQRTEFPMLVYREDLWGMVMEETQERVARLKAKGRW